MKITIFRAITAFRQTCSGPTRSEIPRKFDKSSTGDLSGSLAISNIREQRPLVDLSYTRCELKLGKR